MNIRAFLHKNKSITYIVLASYLLMNIGQSYAMDAVERADAGRAMELKIQNPSELELSKSECFGSDVTQPVTPVDDADSPHGVTLIFKKYAANSARSLPSTKAPALLPYTAMVYSARRLASTKAPALLPSTVRADIKPSSISSATCQESACHFSIKIPTIISSDAYEDDCESIILNDNRIDESKTPNLFYGPSIPDVDESLIDLYELQMARAKESSIGQSPYQLVLHSDEEVDAKFGEEKIDEEKNLEKEVSVETPPNIDLKAKKQSTYKDAIPYVKSFVSFTVSLIASTGLAFFACNLGAKANEGIAYALFVIALVSNAILYHKTIMGITTDDFKVDSSESLLKSLKKACPITVKFNIALVSSIPLAFVTYLINFTQWVPLAYASCVTSLACTIPLFYKAQTAFVDYAKYISNLVNEKNLQKKIRGWDFHNAKDELSALDRNEINVLHNEFLKLKAAHPHDDISNDEFKEFMSLMLPEKLDTLNRFWLKEGAGLASSAFSAVFGGMYLFLVSDPIYEAFFKTTSHASGFRFLSQGYKKSALSGAILVTIGQNALQANTVYGISKIYWMKLMRSYEKRIFGQHAELSVRRNISCYQQYKEYAIDCSKAILAAGSATARAALALTYIDDPALLACVLTGTDISYFATFYWGMSYIENWTETGKKRNELTAFVNAQKIKYLT
jgi:hypothetical protein